MKNVNNLEAIFSTFLRYKYFYYSFKLPHKKLKSNITYTSGDTDKPNILSSILFLNNTSIQILIFGIFK